MTHTRFIQKIIVPVFITLNSYLLYLYTNSHVINTKKSCQFDQSRRFLYVFWLDKYKFNDKNSPSCQLFLEFFMYCKITKFYKHIFAIGFVFSKPKYMTTPVLVKKTRPFFVNLCNL